MPSPILVRNTASLAQPIVVGKQYCAGHVARGARGIFGRLQHPDLQAFWFLGSLLPPRAKVTFLTLVHGLHQADDNWWFPICQGRVSSPGARWHGAGPGNRKLRASLMSTGVPLTPRRSVWMSATRFPSTASRKQFQGRPVGRPSSRVSPLKHRLPLESLSGARASALVWCYALILCCVTSALCIWLVVECWPREQRLGLWLTRHPALSTVLHKHQKPYRAVYGFYRLQIKPGCAPAREVCGTEIQVKAL